MSSNKKYDKIQALLYKLSYARSVELTEDLFCEIQIVLEDELKAMQTSSLAESLYPDRVEVIESDGKITEVVKYDVYRDRPLGWAIISLLTQLEKTSGEKFEKLAGDPSKITIEMKINGFPVRFSHLLDRIEQDSDFGAEKMAQKIIEDKLGDIQDVLEKFRVEAMVRLGRCRED